MGTFKKISKINNNKKRTLKDFKNA